MTANNSGRGHTSAAGYTSVRIIVRVITSRKRKLNLVVIKTLMQYTTYLVWMTFPTKVASIKSGPMPADARAALEEATARSVALPGDVQEENRQNARNSGETVELQLERTKDNGGCSWEQRSACIMKTQGSPLCQLHRQCHTAQPVPRYWHGHETTSKVRRRYGSSRTAVAICVELLHACVHTSNGTRNLRKTQMLSALHQR